MWVVTGSHEVPAAGDVLQSYRKIKLVAEDVNGTNILTNFHGMDLTRCGGRGAGRQGLVVMRALRDRQRGMWRGHGSDRAHTMWSTGRS